MGNSKKMHIAVFPWLAFGHIIPFLELSKKLASKGHHISFISTQRNLERIPKIPDDLLSFITLIPVPMPVNDHLPPNATATTDVPYDKIPFLMEAYNNMEESIVSFLESTTPKADWIIHDFEVIWLAKIASKINIRRALFSVNTAWTLAVIMSPSFSTDNEANEQFLNRLRKANMLIENTHGICDRVESTLKSCDVFILRSCKELDGEAESLHLLQGHMNKDVIPLGMLPVSLRGDDEGSWQKIIKWLEKRRKESVVYIALGSEVAPTQEQITELAYGLELSQVPFFWAWRKPAGSTVELPKGFEDRTVAQGLVWTSWVPQPNILAHESIGAFVSHCGIGSVTEGLQFGKPLIALPFVLDQVLNADYLHQKKAGINLLVDYKSKSINRKSVAESLRLVLLEETRHVYKGEAQKLSKIVADTKLQDKYLDNFEEYMFQNRCV